MAQHFPLLNPDGVIGGVLHPLDGRGNASDTTVALAKAAKAAGAVVLEDVTVTSVRVTEGRVTGVETSKGAIEAQQAITVHRDRAAVKVVDPSFRCSRAPGSLR